MKTKNELSNWLREVSEAGNSVYVVVNGGGISLVSPDETENLIADINGEIEMLNKGQEYEDFRDAMSEEEYDGTESFILVHHCTGYNRENFDVQIQYYEL